MAKNDEDDVLNQDQMTYKNAKLLWEGLSEQINLYLKNKDDMSKFIMWDKLEKLVN